MTSNVRRVVLAEDEAIIRMDLREMLEEEGFEVVAEAANGYDAVREVRQHVPDLAILDIKMPGMDGIRAAEIITREALCAVLILTAFSQRDLAAEAAQAGAMAYLVKPFQKSDLLPAIQVALERNEQLRRLEQEVSELTERLEARKLLDRAKGLLMEQGLSEDQAYRLLRRAAMDRGATIKDIAKAVIDGGLSDPATKAPEAKHSEARDQEPKKDDGA